MITLYDCDTAPSPQRTRILLAEKQIEYTKIQIDLRNNEQLSSEYRSINPRCSVPFLITESGTGISENVAIAAYLEEMYPNPPMMGQSALGKARVLEWNWRAEFEGFVAIQEILRNSSPKLKGRAMTGPHNIEQIPELAERGRIRLAHFFEDANEQLTKSRYLALDQFSFADISLIVAVGFSKWVKATPDTGLTALQAWYQRVQERPSFDA